MVNIAKGLLGLAEGVDAQRDIGGLMYQEASRREGRAYEEAMRKEAEERADLRKIAEEGRADERYAKRLEDEERIWKDRLELTGKATSAEEIAKIEAQGDQMSQLSSQLEALHEHRPDDAKWNPDTKKWDDDGQWWDSVQAKEREYNKAAANLGLKPLSEKKDSYRYGPNAALIYDTVRNSTPEGGENWDDLMTAISGDKESSGYKAALETINKAVDDYIKSPNSPYSQMTGSEQFKLRKTTVDLFTREGHGFVASDPGDSEAPPPQPTTVSGVDVETDTIRPPGHQFEDNIDLERIGQAGSVSEISERIKRTPGGFRNNTLRRELIAAQRTDPQYLLPRLIKERDALQAQLSTPAQGRGAGGRRMSEARLAKLNSMIMQIETFLNPAVGQTGGGMLNRPGMIQMFESGPGLDMSAEAVESRIA